MLGALTGLRSEIDIAPVLMKRLRVQGIFVGSRGSFGEMVKFMGEHGIEPVIDARYPMADLVPALEERALVYRSQRPFVRVRTESAEASP